jgi:hypothetical protein
VKFNPGDIVKCVSCSESRNCIWVVKDVTGHYYVGICLTPQRRFLFCSTCFLEGELKKIFEEN